MNSGVGNRFQRVSNVLQNVLEQPRTGLDHATFVTDGNPFRHHALDRAVPAPVPPVINEPMMMSEPCSTCHGFYGVVWHGRDHIPAPAGVPLGEFDDVSGVAV